MDGRELENGLEYLVMPEEEITVRNSEIRFVLR